jgi:hypothetical protein
MSIGDWYLHKAEQCDRLAAAAVDPIIRTKFEGEGTIWREIMREVEKQEHIETDPP